ncbi:helix-loop-helix DNA binding protein [Gaeumannomyces tritici R3-111a-1]|uniref:Helix-loop-helix DNA binding protein n=1 Tax=Gaeumannomyces tritici (strain R3-111a-1) TaxID=644352 RepID=J3NKX0_GAET3|nr:helix-loop-helix DNA binding protein [Gaeumannomyces tritici R3-111a-1]EJT81937.1 helix-loop-helix DNA binding protein [Gaeumannomyces tritici R3-111a-1]
MAEVAALEQPGLKGEPTAPASPTQKRKRGTESASPESRRSKRGLATANMQVANGDPTDQQVFLDATMTGEHPAPPDNLTDADFSALQQATVDHNDVSDPANASSTAAAALGSMYPTLHVPQTTEETFAAQAGVEPEHSESAFGVSADGLPMDASTLETIQQPSPPNGIRQDLPRYPQAQKPAVGSEEWHKLRKDNHKEVERRRRETINEGINELAKIVPGCEKNKGSILQRSVAFITQLKENETQNIEKWTLEKLLTEQAIAELSQSNDKLKTECERLYRELESWKRVAMAAGLSPEAKDGGVTS